MGQRNVNRALAKALIRYFIAKLCKNKIKPAAQSWVQMRHCGILSRSCGLLPPNAGSITNPELQGQLCTFINRKIIKKKSARITPSEVWPHIILTELLFMICICLFKCSVYNWLLMSPLKLWGYCPCFTMFRYGGMKALLTEFLWIGSRYPKRKRHSLTSVQREKNLPVSGSPVFYPVSHWKTVRKNSYITSTTNDMRIFFKLLLKLAPRRLLFMQKIFLNFKRKVRV